MKKNPNRPAAPVLWLKAPQNTTTLTRTAGMALSTTLIPADALVQQLRVVHTTYHDRLPGPWTVTSTNQNLQKDNT